jgi:uncharacterized hydrophobic protein (TIGR00271 family)
MLHLRVITPADRTRKVCSLLEGHVGVASVVVLPGAARRPEGDVVECDVAREAVNEVFDALRALNIHRDGSIVAEQIDVSISRAADAAEEAAPGHKEDAVVWDELAAQTSEAATLTWSFLIFLTLATQIAAIGVLLDSQILIVGAMVLGPEFGPVAAICLGLLRLDVRRVAAAVRTLAVGFTAAITITFGCALVARWLGWVHPAMLDRNVMTDFIVSPDRWSFIIAVLAGIAGVLSLTAGRSSALVGVFISVTTVPAAGNIAVALALSHGHEVRDSLVQLGVNIAGIVTAGTLTLYCQRLAWKMLPGRARARTPSSSNPLT